MQQNTRLQALDVTTPRGQHWHNNQEWIFTLPFLFECITIACKLSLFLNRYTTKLQKHLPELVAKYSFQHMQDGLIIA